MIRIPFVGGEVWVKWPRMSREECPQHMRFLVRLWREGLLGVSRAGRDIFKAMEFIG